MEQPRYQLLRLIGRGAVAEVFEALALGESGFRRRVAVKRLVAADPALRTAFVDEARILGSIHHQNVVSIVAVGSLEGTLFQVLELVDGLDLGALRQQLDLRGLELPVELCLYIAAEVAKALDVVHRARAPDGAPLGIVHRDVTPRNILLSWEGAVKLADFGVCFAHKRLTHTRIGFTKGTPAFMAPEQAAGAALDGRADLYSLGCVLRFLAGPGASSGPPMNQLLGTFTATDRALRPADADQAASLLLAQALRGGTGGDLSRSLRAFLAPLMPRPPTPKEIPKLAGLFDFEPSGSSEGDIVGYSKVAGRGTSSAEATDTQPWPTRGLSTPAARPVAPAGSRWLAFGLFAVLLVMSALTTLLILRPPKQPSVEIAPVLAIQPAAQTSTRAAAPSVRPEPEPRPEVAAPPKVAGATSRLRAPRRPDERILHEPHDNITTEVERLSVRLRIAGLRPEDLSPSLMARWDAAVTSQSVDLARALWPEVDRDIERVRASTAVLRRRIAAGGQRLRTAAGKAPALKVEALERTYFDLRKRLVEPMTEGQASQLIAELNVWERDIRALELDAWEQDTRPGE